MAVTVEGLDYVKDGQPWCKITARTDIDVSGLDWVKDGQPWAAVSAEVESDSSTAKLQQLTIFRVW